MTTTTLDTHPGLPEILAEERRHRARGRALRWGLALAAGAALAAAAALLGGRDVGPAPALRVEAVTRGDVVHEVSATGRLEARGTVSVGPEISGRIAAVDVDFNDHVRRGQVLARFDTAALQAQLDLARANLRTAGVALRRAELDAARTERERRRVEPLRAGGMVAAAELDAAVDAELQAAELLRSARAQVELQRATSRWRTRTASTRRSARRSTAW
jgi:HlyD family secretion protein